jgi:hypothetical protein
MQAKYLKTARFFFVLILSAATFLNAKAQDTIVLKTSEFDKLANALMTEQKLSENFRSGFDSLRAWYNDLSEKYNRSQANLQSCMNERDTAHAYITSLRTQISKAWTDRDIALSKAETEHNKTHKAFGVGLSAGYDPFGRRVFIGPSIHWSLFRFSLRGMNDGWTAPTEKPATSVYDKLR